MSDVEETPDEQAERIQKLFGLVPEEELSKTIPDRIPEWLEDYLNHDADLRKLKNEVEDLKKAVWYINREIRRIENEK